MGILWNFYFYRFKNDYLSLNKAKQMASKNKLIILFFYAFDLDYWKDIYKELINEFDEIEYIKNTDLKEFVKKNNKKKKYLILNKKSHAMYYYHYMRKNNVKVYLLNEKDSDKRVSKL